MAMAPRTDEQLIEHFWSCVEKTPGCWLWHGSRAVQGYGRIRRQRHTIFAHRLSYTINVGPIPDGYEVCHTCDNPSCVNPAHLFTGTHAENMHDRDAKGRTRRADTHGERNPKARFTENDVRAIRAAYAAGESQAAIGRRYGTTRYVIHVIVKRHTWKHIP